MVEHVQQMGLTQRKAWAMAETMALEQPSAGDLAQALRPVNEQGTPLINEEGKPTVWSFHVAPAVEVQAPSGDRQVLVIDCSLAGQPLTLQQWHERVGTPASPHSRQVTPLGQSPIDPFTGFPFAGTGYWPHRGGDPDVGPGQHARDAMASLLRRFPLAPL
jgi:hypothetical protein